MSEASNTSTEWKNRLGSIIDQVAVEGHFACSGGASDGLVLPKLAVTGIGSVRLPLRGNQTADLFAAGQPAPFGKGLDTVLDPAVRRATQLDASSIYADLEWEKTLQKITAEVTIGLGVDAFADVRARLHKLLLYEPGGHFVAHRDTEKEPGMFATLVVQLPVEGGHTGGTLRVTHRGQAFEWDTAAVSREGHLSYAAFYADCEHELTAVASGLRMVLTYNLVRVDPGSQPRAPRGDGPGREPLEAAVRAWQSTPAADRVVVIPLEHKYTKTNLSFSGLKGRDAAVARLLAGCELLDVDLALVTKTVAGDVDAEPWKRQRNSSGNALLEALQAWSNITDKERYMWNVDVRDAVMGEVRYDWVSIMKWVPLSGQDDGPAAAEGSNQEDYDSVNTEGSDTDETDDSEDSDGEDEMKGPDFEFDVEACLLRGGALFDADAEPDERKYVGYTGNEGCTLNYSYHRAVLVVWPRAFKRTLTCAGGFRVAVYGLGWLVEQLTSPSGTSLHRYWWRRPKRANIDGDAVLREFKALLDAVLEMAEVTPEKAFPGTTYYGRCVYSGANAELALKFGASAAVVELAGSSVLCRFVAALASSEGLASDSVVRALAAAAAAVAEPAVADSVLALVKSLAVRQFERCVQLAQEPAMPEALRGRVAQALMEGDGFLKLPQEDVLRMARLVCEGGPAFTQHQAAFSAAVRGRPDARALLRALRKEPGGVRELVADGSPATSRKAKKAKTVSVRTRKGADAAATPSENPPSAIGSTSMRPISTTLRSAGSWGSCIPPLRPRGVLRPGPTTQRRIGPGPLSRQPRLAHPAPLLRRW